jgi:hypothetical protein
MSKGKHTLVKDSNYEGKFVALRSVIDHTVVAFGDEPEKVSQEAKKNGADQPLIMYVPDKNMSFCYKCQ